MTRPGSESREALLARLLAELDRLVATDLKFELWGEPDVVRCYRTGWRLAIFEVKDWVEEELASGVSSETEAETAAVGRATCYDYEYPARVQRVHVFHDGASVCDCGDLKP